MINQTDIERITDTDVYDRDGDKIGRAGQVYVDDATGTPEWISVHRVLRHQGVLRAAEPGHLRR